MAGSGNILVTGGAGYIGSDACKALKRAIYIRHHGDTRLRSYRALRPAQCGRVGASTLDNCSPLGCLGAVSASTASHPEFGACFRGLMAAELAVRETVS